MASTSAHLFLVCVVLHGLLRGFKSNPCLSARATYRLGTSTPATAHRALGRSKAHQGQAKMDEVPMRSSLKDLRRLAPSSLARRARRRSVNCSRTNISMRLVAALTAWRVHHWHPISESLLSLPTHATKPVDPHSLVSHCRLRVRSRQQTPPTMASTVRRCGTRANSCGAAASESRATRRDQARRSCSPVGPPRRAPVRIGQHA